MQIEALMGVQWERRDPLKQFASLDAQQLPFVV
jgi:hypothetical protein